MENFSKVQEGDNKPFYPIGMNISSVPEISTRPWTTDDSDQETTADVFWSTYRAAGINFMRDNQQAITQFIFQGENVNGSGKNVYSIVNGKKSIPSRGS